MAAYFNKKTRKYDLHFYADGRQFTVRGFKTRDEAEENENYLRERKQADKTSLLSPITFDGLVKNYIAEEVSQMKPLTRYALVYRLNKHYLGIAPNKTFRNYLYQDVYEWFKYIDATDYIGKNRYLSLMKAIFKYARKRYQIDNLFLLDQLPHFREQVYEPKERIVYSVEEFIYFRKQISNFQNYVMVTLFYLCGMRTAEVRAMTWDESVLLDQKKIVVYKAGSNKTMEKGFNVFTPKSRDSRRIIPISDYLVDLLRKLRSTQKKSNKGDFVFPSPVKGVKSPIGESHIKRFIDDASKVAGLPQIDKHELRHSFATSLNNINGISAETISSLLGHASKGVTEAVYIHANVGSKIKAIDALSDLVSEDSKYLKITEKEEKK